MSVPKHKRSLSDMEFYHQARQLRRDLVLDLLVRFENGLYKEKFETQNGTQIETVEKYPQFVVDDIRNHIFSILAQMSDSITLGNSIYPSTLEECIERRSYQNRAIGFL